jgi:Ca-activated chloride channel homolog
MNTNIKRSILLTVMICLTFLLFTTWYPIVAQSDIVDITIIYAPESETYLPQIIESFNRAYESGRNPLTGEILKSDEPRIHISDQAESSGIIMQGIIAAVNSPSNSDLPRPTIFQPSVTHWLRLTNLYSGQEIFNLNEATPTALAPVVIAIWESRLQAIRNKVGYDNIGWEELLDVLNSPGGWRDYGIQDGHQQVYYGHTDPFVSSTGLSTLIAEFYASAQFNNLISINDRLNSMAVSNPEVQDGVRKIQELVRHYSNRTTEFKNYIAQGPDYIDFVALEENDLIAINRGLTAFTPPERLVGLYPKEGTFMHEHPMAVVNAYWTTKEQRDAARIFIEYVLLPTQQQIITEQGFRPVTPQVALSSIFNISNGVTLAGPTSFFQVPEDAVIREILSTWSIIRKQADIMLVIDISGSMAEDNKLGSAQQAALSFLAGVQQGDNIGLITFNDQIFLNIEPDSMAIVGNNLRDQIGNLFPDGDTALFQALSLAIDEMEKLDGDGRIRLIILLSDGENTEPGIGLVDTVRRIRAISDSRDPIIIIPIVYSDKADVLTLIEIARASSAKEVYANPDNIVSLLEQISTFLGNFGEN